MGDALERISRELFERLTTEGARPQSTPSTHLVGGIVKACANLESLLRETVVVVADIERIPPETLLAPTGGRPLMLKKAMAGPLAHGLKAHCATSNVSKLPAAARTVVADLTARDSRILAFIQVRNEVAKEGREPRDAHIATARLRELIASLRKAAGWA